MFMIIAHKGSTKRLCSEAIVHFVIAKECEPFFQSFVAVTSKAGTLSHIQYVDFPNQWKED
jgi:hypothetical protein